MNELSIQGSWDYRFLELARVVSTWSKDPGLKVGAVIVNRRRKIVSVGYNGFPRKIQDNYNISRESKLDLTIHAEMNAILNATQSIEDCTIYVHPIPPCHRLVFLFLPCIRVQDDSSYLMGG